jgi:hypothetical protein
MLHTCMQAALTVKPARLIVRNGSALCCGEQGSCCRDAVHWTEVAVVLATLTLESPCLLQAATSCPCHKLQPPVIATPTYGNRRTWKRSYIA